MLPNVYDRGYVITHCLILSFDKVLLYFVLTKGEIKLKNYLNMGYVD
jgi:hypothetical protein